MKKSTKLSAFTLIELLIVIAIIGILAGLMAAGITAAMDKAKATDISNKGRNIVQAVLQANNDRVGAALSELWPTTDDSGQAKFDSSNKYFARLMDKKLIQGLAYADFAGAGVAAAKDKTTLEAGGCVWNVLAGIANLDGYAPFIWTRNLSGITKDDFEESDETKIDDKLDANVNPFGDKRVVLARKGGGVQTIEASLLTHSTFLGGSSNVVDKLAILAAVEGDSGATDDWQED